MAPDEFGRRMNHDVGAIFHRPDQVRCAKRIVYDQGDPLGMGHFSHPGQIDQVSVRITDRLYIPGFGLCSGCRDKGVEIIRIGKKQS